MKAYGLGVLLALAVAATAHAGNPGCQSCVPQNCRIGHVFGCDRQPPPDTWDGSYWGFCTSRSRNMHLWDNYCAETSPCPCCGHDQGHMFCHTFCRKRCLTNGCDSGTVDAGTVSGDAETIAPESSAPAGSGTIETRLNAGSRPKTPVLRPVKVRK